MLLQEHKTIVRLHVVGRSDILQRRLCTYWKRIGSRLEQSVSAKWERARDEARKPGNEVLRSRDT